jgi:lipopolysaccharide export system protein LptC
MSSRTEFIPDGTDKLLRAAARRARLAPILSWIAVACGLGLVLLFALQSGMFSALLPKTVQQPPTVGMPEQISGQKSRIAGFDRQLQPYEITADEGYEDKTNANLAHLKTVVGNFRKANGQSYQLLSATGLYNSKTKDMELQGGVKILQADHFTTTMDKAHVNVETKDLVSDVPVLVVMPTGTIKANGMKITNDGNNIVFLNGVKAQFEQASDKGDEAQ